MQTTGGERSEVSTADDAGSPPIAISHPVHGYRVRRAAPDDLPAITKIARANQFTKDFPGRSIATDWPLYFENGWVRIAEMIQPEPVGYIVIRPRQNQPFTTLHWMGVAQEARRLGVGARLLQQAWLHSPHMQMRLKVNVRNEGAVAFYEASGFRTYGSRGDELQMKCERDDWWECWTLSERG